MQRREIVLGGALTLIWGGCICPAHAQDKRSPGCTIEPDEAQSFFSKTTGEGFSATGNETIIPQSGDRDFDRALAITLSRMTDVLGVLPGFGYYDDSSGLNAYATPVKRMQQVDGTVLFGKGLLAKTLREPEHPDVAISAVCAHEYGHILQYKRNLIKPLSEGQSTVKRVELQADFLSGYYAGVRKLQKSDYPAAVYATTAHSIGDYMFTDRNHHGTPNERAAAIVRGFEVGHNERKGLDEAVQVGLNYAMRL